MSVIDTTFNPPYHRTETEFALRPDAYPYSKQSQRTIFLDSLVMFHIEEGHMQGVKCEVDQEISKWLFCLSNLGQLSPAYIFNMLLILSV